MGLLGLESNLFLLNLIIRTLKKSKFTTETWGPLVREVTPDMEEFKKIKVSIFHRKNHKILKFLNSPMWQPPWTQLFLKWGEKPQNYKRRYTQHTWTVTLHSWSVAMRHTPHSWSMKWQAPNPWQAAMRYSLPQWTVEKRQWIWRHATHSTPQTHIPRIKKPRNPFLKRVVKKLHLMIMSKMKIINMSKRHIKWKNDQRGLKNIKNAMHYTHHKKTLNRSLLTIVSKRQQW